VIVDVDALRLFDIYSSSLSGIGSSPSVNLTSINGLFDFLHRPFREVVFFHINNTSGVVLRMELRDGRYGVRGVVMETGGVDSLV